MSIGQYDVKGHPLEFALYLEGVRVPFIGATVSSAPNRPSTCVIDLPPFASAARIRPKTLVHLMYLDTAFVNPDFTNPSPDLEQWRLLYEGEVSHVRVVQKSASRSISVVCQDLTNYWNHTYQYFINNQHGQIGSPTEIATFANGIDQNGEPIAEMQTIYNVDFGGSTGDIVLNSILKNGIRLTVPLGLLDLLVKIGGEASKSSPTGINSFFRQAEQRLLMARRVFMVPDANIARFLRTQAGSALSYIKQFTGSLSGLGTVSDVVKKFLGHCFYDYVTFTAPPYASNPSKDVTEAGSINNDPQSFPDNLPAVSTTPTILSTMLKPKTFFLPPPRCNILFPSKVSSFQYSQSFLDEPSRIRLKIAQGFPGDGVPFSTGFQEQVIYAPPMPGNPFQVEANRTLDIAEKVATGQPADINDVLAVPRDYTTLVFDNTRNISEAETGIIPVFDTLDQTQGVVIGELSSTNLPPEASIQDKLETLLAYNSGTTFQSPDTATNVNARNRFRYYLDAANYQLDIRKFAERSVNGIDGGFNPNLLVGFPAALLSSMGLMVGELASVTHRIDVTSGATTSCQMSHARTLPIPSFLSTLTPDQLNAITFDVGSTSSYLVDPVTGQNVGVIRNSNTGQEEVIADRKQGDFPVFINDSFKPQRIGQDVYEQPFFGTKSIFARVGIGGGGSFFEAGNVGGFNGDQYAAVFAHYVDYLRAPDKVSFVNYATQRNITSIINLRTHYGSGATFNPVYQDYWHTLTADEFLFGGPGAGPVFKAGGISTKQLVVMALTQDMRIALGRENGVNMLDDVFGLKHRAGGASGA